MQVEQAPGRDRIVNIRVPVGTEVPDTLTVAIDESTTAAVMRWFQERRGSDTVETMAAVLLDSREVPLGYMEYRIGSAQKTTMRLREVAQAALLLNACNLIVVHNHPSGNAAPSIGDLVNALRMKAALPLFDIELLGFGVVTATETHELDLSKREADLKTVGNMLTWGFSTLPSK